MYRILADMVIVLHLLWIGFVIFGFPVFLYLNHRRGRLIHLAALGAMVAMQLTRTICPLTYLEVFLKSKGSAVSVYPGEFLIGLIERMIYVEEVTLLHITIATILYFIVVLLSFRFRPLKPGRES